MKNVTSGRFVVLDGNLRLMPHDSAQATALERRRVLAASAATVGVGLLPTYDQIGVWAPILLVLLRCLQGFSAGGEWAGAALMAVEHAPPEKRAWYGSASQIGVPIGRLLANAMFLLMTSVMPNETFLRWGWRIPFLVSNVLVWLGFYIRSRMERTRSSCRVNQCLVW